MGCINKLIFGPIIAILYVSMLMSGVFHARSSYLVIYYFLMFLLPPTLSALRGNINGVINTALTVCLAVFMYMYFRGLFTWANIIWLVVTTWVYIQYNEDNDVSDITGAVVRVIMLVLLGIWFWRTESTRFVDTNMPGVIQTPISSIAGVSKVTKQAISQRADVIVAPMAYEVDGQYIFRVAPVHPTYFSYSTYVEKGDAKALNQLVGEIRLVSKVKNGGSGVGAFISGVLHGLLGMIKGIFSLVFHPINTVKALWGVTRGVFSMAIHEPAAIILKPYDAFREYGQSLDQGLAAQYEVDLASLRLPETLSALNTSRRSMVAGQAAFEVATFVLPAGKLGEARYLGKVDRARSTSQKAINAIREGGHASKVAATEGGELIVKDVKISEDAVRRAIARDDVANDAGALVNKNRARVGADDHVSSGTTAKEVETGSPSKTSKQEVRAKSEESRARHKKENRQKGPVKDGPEDKQFDANKLKEKTETTHYGEDEFTAGDAGKGGRKPTPDRVSDDGETKIYWEDKRPSECKDGGNSWLSTYKNDPIAKVRKEARECYKRKQCTKEEAEAKVIIEEHDDHYRKKGKRWDDPEKLKGKTRIEKLGIDLPDTPTNRMRMENVFKQLQEAGRNPKMTIEDGVIKIVYDPPIT